MYIAKEYWIKGSNLNVWYFRSWDALFELFFGLLLAPIVFIPLPGRDVIAPHNFGNYLLDATECFLGMNVNPTVDHCNYAWFLYFWTLIFNIIYNILSLALTKYVSASTTVVASAAVVPVSAVMYLWPFLAGLATISNISVETIVAIPVVMIGIVVYRLVDEQSKVKTPEMIAEPASRLFVQNSIQEETDPLLNRTP